jgi:hypothetical protein
MKTIIEISVIHNTSKSLPTSLLPARSTTLGARCFRNDPVSGPREESSPIQAKLVPHFGKGGLGGICLVMFDISSMMEFLLIPHLQTPTYENN